MDKSNKYGLYLQICNDYGNVCYSHKTHIEEAVVINIRENVITFLQVFLLSISSTGFINIVFNNKHIYSIIATGTSFFALLLIYIRLSNRKLNVYMKDKKAYLQKMFC